MHQGRNITHECLLSQSVSVLSSFKCMQSVMLCLKKMFNGEIIFHLRGDIHTQVATLNINMTLFFFEGGEGGEGAGGFLTLTLKLWQNDIFLILM